MPHPAADNAAVENIWRSLLERGQETRHLRQRRIFRLLPTDPRCKFCNAPFHGVGAAICRALYGKAPSKMNPAMCNVCEDFAAKHQGGAEIPLSMLFADVRGSTSLAESMSTADFARLIDRFYKVGTHVLVSSDALVDKLIGDQVTGLYVPGFAGPDHARLAIQAAQDLLRVTGHADPAGAWIPLGASVHTGVAFVGAVGSKDGLSDITALGDAPNVAARLASKAQPGEVLISEMALAAAGLDAAGLESRQLALKGKAEPMRVWVMRVSPG